MERRARDARVTSLPTAGGLTAAWVLVTLVSLLGASPDPELQGAGTQTVGTRGTGTDRASDRPEIPQRAAQRRDNTPGRPFTVQDNKAWRPPRCVPSFS